MREILKNVKEKMISKYSKSDNPKKFKPRLKARIRKNKHLLVKNIDNFFDWIKGAEIIELKKCNTSEDPVRPELDNKFRTSYGRKIYGVKYKGEIHAVMCFAFTNEIPKSVEELDMMSKDAFLQSIRREYQVGKIAIAYTTSNIEQILNIHSTYNVGDIYIGVVESMLENLDIAFIKLDEWRENGFMVLKNEFFFKPKENIKLGEEVIVEIIKEPISKKGPTVTKNISLQDEEIKIYPSNKNDTDIAKGFNKKKKKYLSVVSKLVKSKKFGLSIAKKKGEIDLWEFVYRLQKLQTKKF